MTAHIESLLKKRTNLLHVIYPPTMTTMPPARVREREMRERE